MPLWEKVKEESLKALGTEVVALFVLHLHSTAEKVRLRSVVQATMRHMKKEGAPFKVDPKLEVDVVPEWLSSKVMGALQLR